jgi:RHS repeat-associated protein
MSICRIALVASLVLAVVHPAPGQTSRGDGSQTGDGSTPFTGLAQAPEANMFVGAATSSIPIQVPPGHKNITPKLSLNYNSDGGPSPYGYGWDLTLPRVQRSAKNGTWPNFPANELEFVLSVPGSTIDCSVGDPVNGGRCQPKVEEGFVKINASVTGTGIVWDVWDKNGIHYIFGGNAASTDGGATFNQPAATGDNSLYHSDGNGHAATWALTSIQDTTNNRLDVHYLLIQGVLYPYTIQYGGNGGFPHQFQVAFQWEERDDQLENGSGGAAAALTQRLSQVDVQTIAGGTQSPVLVRSYHLGYVTGRVGRQTFLESVTLVGSDGSSVLMNADNQPADSVFTYQTNPPGFVTSAPLTLSKMTFRTPYNGASTVPGVLRFIHPGEGTRRDVLDMNGDGIPDLVDAWPIHHQNTGCPFTGGADYWDVYLGCSAASLPGTGCDAKAGFSTVSTHWTVPNSGLMCDIRRNDVNATADTSVGTVDLTGDGIPDFVDARTVPWTVYPGTYSSTTGWGFGAAISWNADSITPYPVFVQRTRPNAVIGNPGSGNDWTGSMVRQDLIDMNGDGRPDVVQTPNMDEPQVPSPTQWTVWLNTGQGFGPAHTFYGAFKALSFQADNSNENGMVYGTFDINGDGLPDQVMSQHYRAGAGYTGGWTVCLNTGQATDDCSTWLVPALGAQGQSLQWRNITKGNDAAGDAIDMHREFIDINGDGLPDVVDASGSSTNGGYWQVFLNRGDGFEQTALQWWAPSTLIRKGASVTEFETIQDTFDVDSDGMVDFIDFTSTGSYTIRYSNAGAWQAGAGGVTENDAGGRPDLLVASENGIGSTTDLQYRPSTQWDNTGGDGVPDLPFNTWTVTLITQGDGFGNEVGTKYSYRYGRYDPVGRAFRGFADVQAEAVVADPAIPHRGVYTQFDQRVTLSGKVDSSITFDAGSGGTYSARPLFAIYNTWGCASLPSGSVITCPTLPNGNVWARLSQAEERTYSSATSYKSVITSNNAWHTCGGQIYGNVQDATRGGLGVFLNTHTDYACVNNSSQYMVDRPTHVVVRNSNNTKVLEEKWYYYDGNAYGQLGAQGNVTRTDSWLDQSVVSVPACTNSPSGGAGAGCVSTTMNYDVFANVTSITDALGRSTTTSYDATMVYPATITDPLNHKVTRQYDPGCGTLLTETIPYTWPSPSSRQTAHQYDVFCRPTKTWRPGETGTPYRSYAYYLGGSSAPTAVFTYSREPNSATGTVLTSVLTDALGRTIEQKSQGEVEGSPANIATITQYDGAGYVGQGSVAFTWGSPTYAPYNVYTPPPGGTGETVFENDAVGRPIRQTNPDGTYRLMDYGTAWQTTTEDECSHDANCSGEHIVENRDALGHTVQRTHTDESGTTLASTQFGYDEEGRLLTTRQWDTTTGTWNTHTTVTTTYDSLGRKVQVVDPDSGATAAAGTWKDGYDRVGNLIYQDDPATGRHLEFCYDSENRVTKKFILNTGDAYAATSCSSTATVSYAYNEGANLDVGLGLLASVTDAAGSYAVLSYDTLGRVLHERRRITPVGESTTTADISYGFDSTGDHLSTITYPDGEVVSYSYDGAGHVDSLTGSETYLLGITYDVFGRPRTITHPNAVEDIRTYGDGSTNYRLSQIKTTLGSTNPTTLFEYDYVGYDANGRLTAVNDSSPSHGPGNVLDNGSRASFDGLGELVSANYGPFLPLHSYTYDKAIDNIQTKDGVSLTYNTAQKPHQALTYNGQTVHHDADGNTDIGPTAAGSHTFTYDVEGHLTGIDSGQETFLYDYTGRRTVRQVVGSPTTRYYNALFEADSDGTITKYYYAGSLLIASAHKTTTAGPFAAADFDAAVRVASRSLTDGTAVVLVVRRDVQLGLAATMLFGASALVFAPWRRKRVVGVRIRKGHAIGLALLVGATQSWPIILRPAPAEAQCPPPAIAAHYHLDHLGSTQLVTSPTGGVLEYVRYTPYGEVRGRYNASGSAIAFNEQYRHEFTGYESDASHSGLEYAGGRWYNPTLAMFQTHDGAGQFPNPYTYTNWDPIDRTDPNGECVWDGCLLEGIVIAAIIGSIAGATAAGIQAAVSGASIGNIFKAAAIGQGIGAASGALTAGVLDVAVGPALAALSGIPVEQATQDAGIALTIASIGQSAYSLSQGQYAGGAIGLAVAGVGLALAFSQGADGVAKAGGGPASRNAEENLAIAQHWRLGGTWGIGNTTVGDFQAPDVASCGEGWDIGDVLEGAFDYVNTIRSLQNADVYIQLRTSAEHQVADLGAPHTLFSARLEFTPGAESRYTDIEWIGTIRGLGFPSAGPSTVDPAAGKVWFTLRSFGAAVPVGGGPVIEPFITQPSQLGLSHEIFLSTAGI